jgi:type IV fimbrial biogenesis protein FimT
MNMQHQAAIAAPRAQSPRGPSNRHGAPTPITVRVTQRRPPRGFTLIEMLVVMAIIAIFASFAIPSFRGLIASASVSNAVNAFVADTRYARGEAMRRGKSVTICRSANSAAITPACSSGDGAAVGGWMEGWMVFVDEDGDGAFDGGTDTVVRVQEPFTGLGSFLALTNAGSPRNDRNYLTYNATGRAVGLMGRWLVQAQGISSAANTTQTRTLCLNILGRVKTYTGGIPCP